MINKTAGKALLLSVAAFSVMMTGCGSNKATEAANESVESEDPEGKAKNSDDAEEEEKEETSGEEQA